MVGGSDWTVFQVQSSRSHGEDVSQSEIHRRLVNVYDQNVLSRKEVCAWSNKLKDSHTALTDDPEEQRGRPTASHAEEKCDIVEGLIWDDRKVRKIVEMTGIPKSTLHKLWQTRACPFQKH